MPEIQIVPLGAGQDVGRSCILVSIGGHNVMLDCGMHMGYQDERRFPDFTFIARSGGLDEYLACVIISHFHLDHCGSLPYMSEMVGFAGPIYMTHPTKAIAPVLLEDYRKIQVDRKGEKNFFTSEMIKNCMKKVNVVNLHEVATLEFGSDSPPLEIKAHYAGHVLGAAMFEVRCGDESFVYTGDYNMTPDRHLGAAAIDACSPDLLISESTYATTIRDSKRARERQFLRKVHDCVANGGKVLIPVFALGRAQELCILLESYWERMNLKVPIYFTMGLTTRANDYYRLFISWTNEKIKKNFVQRNMFEFKHIRVFERSYADLPGPQVLFATPGMLHSGTSLDVFRKWAPDERNMLIMPGYCVANTVGHAVINGAKKVHLGGREIEVKLSVEYMSFSAHADAKGIMQLISQCQPKNLMFVHGEKEKMMFLANKVRAEFDIPVFCPANGESVIIPTQPDIPIDIRRNLLRQVVDMSDCSTDKRNVVLRGASVVQSQGATSELTIQSVEDTAKQLNLPLHEIRTSVRLHLPMTVDILEIVQPCISNYVNKVETTVTPNGTCIQLLPTSVEISQTSSETTVTASLIDHFLLKGIVSRLKSSNSL